MGRFTARSTQMVAADGAARRPRRIVSGRPDGGVGVF
jgi:hypothetical protein